LPVRPLAPCHLGAIRLRNRVAGIAAIGLARMMRPAICTRKSMPPAASITDAAMPALRNQPISARHQRVGWSCAPGRQLIG
jgi:hypothetical protein